MRYLCEAYQSVSDFVIEPFASFMTFAYQFERQNRPKENKILL